MTKILGYRGKRIDPVFHGWFCGELMKDESTLFLMPRDHTKSTTGIEVKVVQEILADPNQAILLASLTASLSKDRLAVVKHHLTNRKLLTLYPDILWNDPESAGKRGETRWTKEAIRVKRQVTRVDETVEIAGMGTNITGKHYDKIFLDDVINEDNITSEAQTEKVLLWWRLLHPIAAPGCIYRIYGTRYDEFDLYGHLISEIKQDEKDGLKPLLRVILRKVKEHGKFIYSFYNERILEEKQRKINNQYVFQCQYYNDPNPEEERLFRPPYPEYVELPTRGEGDYEFYMTVDPAFTTTSTADFTGIVICGYDKDNNVWVEMAQRFKITVVQLLYKLYELNEDYNCACIGIERGAWQSALMDMFDRIVSTDGLDPLPIVDVKTPNTKDAKHNRIVGVSSYLEKKILKIKTGNTDLLNEMYYYSATSRQKDDVLDALSMQPLIHVWGIVDSGRAQRFERKKQTYRDVFHPEPVRGYGYY